MAKFVPKLILVLTIVILLLTAACATKTTTSIPAQTTSSATTTIAPTTTTTSSITTSTSLPSPTTTATPAIFRVGLMGGITGPAAASVTRQLQEQEDMLRYTNEVEGGIGGVQLQWKTIDNKGTPDGSVIAYRELRDGFKPHLYVAIEDYYYAGVIPNLIQDKAVLIATSAIVPQLYNPPGRIFSISMSTADGFAAYVNWVLADWKGTGKPKVGVMYWDDTQSGQQWMTARAWAAQKVDLVPVGFSIAALDLTPQFIKLRESKVDYIWALALTSNAVVAVRDAASLGIQVPITFMEYVEADELIRQAGSKVQGFTDYQAHSPYSDNTQASQLYSKIYKRSQNKDVWSDNRLVITLKGLLNALVPKVADEVRAGTITGDSIYNALNTLNSIDTWGNNKDFGFAPDKRVGLSTIKIKRYTGTGTQAVSDWITMPRIFEGVVK